MRTGGVEKAQMDKNTSPPTMLRNYNGGEPPRAGVQLTVCFLSPLHRAGRIDFFRWRFSKCLGAILLKKNINLLNVLSG